MNPTIAYNFKSDFRNYGVFIAQAGQRLMGASQLCFANDSFVIVEVHPLWSRGARTNTITPLFQRRASRSFGFGGSVPVVAPVICPGLIVYVIVVAAVTPVQLI